MTLNKLKAAFFAVAAAGLATEALADSASFTVTVTIPPLAEALAARDNGAAGDWTILTSGGGFLVDLPDGAQDEAAAVDDTASAPLAVYRSDRNRFTLSLVGDDGDTVLAPISVVPGANLVQMNYVLPQVPATTNESDHLRVVFAGL